VIASSHDCLWWVTHNIAGAATDDVDSVATSAASTGNGEWNSDDDSSAQSAANSRVAKLEVCGVMCVCVCVHVGETMTMIVIDVASVGTSATCCRDAVSVDGHCRCALLCCKCAC
jgi:hypothetical protein